MKLTLSWYSYGPGVQTGWTNIAQQVAQAAFPTATFSTPVVESAPATVSNIRRESTTLDDGSVVQDDGLTADVVSSLLSRGSETGLFVHPTADLAGRAPTTAELTELRQWVAAITRVSKITVAVTVPSATDAQIRALRLRLNETIGTYLRDNGRFLLGSAGVRIAKSSSSVWLYALAVGAVWFTSRQVSR
jgi:hypothetical protein